MKSFKIAFCLLFATCCLLPSTLFAQKQKRVDTQTQIFTKNYNVNPNDVLEVKARYTKICFQEWDKNEIDFMTTVTLKNATEKEMEQLLSELKITANQSGKKTTFQLLLNFSNNKKNRNINMEIVLVVKIPKDIFLNVESSFGNVEIINLINDLNASVSFGNLTIEKLHGITNKINIQHGGFKIQSVNHLSLSTTFSKNNIKEAGSLILNSGFGTVNIDRVKSLVLSSSHDRISILDYADKIDGTMSFGTLKINTLKTSCVLSNFSFSTITTDAVLMSFKDIHINASHSTLRLNVLRDQSFALDYSGDFTSFKDADIKLNEATFKSSSNSTQMSGIYGSNLKPGKSVKITANFGSVSLFGK